MAGKIKTDTIQGESQLKFNIGETTYITIGGASWNVALPMNVQSTFSTMGDATINGNLTVSGATTTVNTTNLVVSDKNIEIANSASPTDALADGAGITVRGSTNKTITWSNTTKAFTFNTGIDIGSVIENANITATALTGTQNINVLENSINFYTANNAANWTMNVRANSSTRLDAIMSTGESMTVAYLATQLSANTFYQSAFQIDGASVTPK